MKRIKKLLLAFFAIVISAGLNAQNLVVTLTNSTTEIFTIEGIQSIKFGDTSMILNELDGTVTVWDIDDIDNYAFDLTTSLNDDLNIASSTLNIYPNPATSLVNIEFSTTQSSRVTIDIIDVSGRIVEQIYQGDRQDGQKYQWNSNVQKGIYLCRIMTESKTITKPVVIH